MINFRFSVKLIIKKTKLNSKGLIPINVQLKLNLQFLSFSSGISINPVLCGPEAQKAVGRTKLVRDTNHSLISIHVDLENLYYKLVAREDIITMTRIRNIFLDKDSLKEEYFLMDLFNKLTEQKQLLAKNNAITAPPANS